MLSEQVDIPASQIIIEFLLLQQARLVMNRVIDGDHPHFSGNLVELAAISTNKDSKI
jgi:hypothetical protein